MPIVNKGLAEITGRPRSKSRFWATLAVGTPFIVIGALVMMDPAQAGETVKPAGWLKAKWKTTPTATTSVPVEFFFQREEQGSGRISVQLGPEGAQFAGTYLRLTGKRPLGQVRFFHTYWVSDGFDGFSRGPGGSPINRKQITVEQFQQRYLGSVVATLISSERGGMRCVFDLLDPEGGLANGATGRCQITDGGIIELVSPARR